MSENLYVYKNLSEHNEVLLKAIRAKYNTIWNKRLFLEDDGSQEAGIMFLLRESGGVEEALKQFMAGKGIHPEKTRHISVATSSVPIVTETEPLPQPIQITDSDRARPFLNKPKRMTPQLCKPSKSDLAPDLEPCRLIYENITEDMFPIDPKYKAIDIPCVDSDKQYITSTRRVPQYTSNRDEFYFGNFLAAWNKRVLVIGSTWDSKATTEMNLRRGFFYSQLVNNMFIQDLRRCYRLIIGDATYAFYRRGPGEEFACGTLPKSGCVIDCEYTYMDRRFDKSSNTWIEEEFDGFLRLKIDDLLGPNALGDIVSSSNIIFKPYIDPDTLDPKIFNFFTGYQAKIIDPIGTNLTTEERSEIEPWFFHYYNIWCSQNELWYNWLMNWFAEPILTGDKIDKFLLLIGEQGCGKDKGHKFYNNWVIGKGLVKVYTDLITMFNTNFNAEQVGKTRVHIEELSSVKDSYNLGTIQTKLKGKITSDDLEVHGKGKDKKDTQNYIVFSANSNHTIPMTLEKGDRRTMALDCSNVVTVSEDDTFEVIEQKMAYFDKLESCSNQRCGDLMLKYFLSEEFSHKRISNFKGKKPPLTPAKERLTVAEHKGKACYFEEIKSGDWCLRASMVYYHKDKDGDHLFISSDDLFKDYESWSREQGFTKSSNKITFGRSIKAGFGDLLTPANINSRGPNINEDSLGRERCRGYFINLEDESSLQFVNVTTSKHSGDAFDYKPPTSFTEYYELKQICKILIPNYVKVLKEKPESPPPRLPLSPGYASSSYPTTDSTIYETIRNGYQTTPPYRPQSRDIASLI